ncbi:MAG: SlyX family protein [Steroidobacteraceae bacterium]|nr:SlyX family protein [Steroidobacteraceae bacterium]
MPDQLAPVDRTNRRIETIEEKLAHIERTVQELSDLLYKQQRELDAVTRRHQLLLQQLDTMVAPSVDGSDDPLSRLEKPPHY